MGAAKSIAVQAERSSSWPVRASPIVAVFEILNGETTHAAVERVLALLLLRPGMTRMHDHGCALEWRDAAGTANVQHFSVNPSDIGINTLTELLPGQRSMA